MKAQRAFRLIVRRGGRGPAFLADPRRSDQVEVVEIDSGETVLLWDCTPAQASRLARRLREALAEQEPEEFLAAWRDHEE